jgi:trehalose 6-phosphate synthase
MARMSHRYRYTGANGTSALNKVGFVSGPDVVIASNRGPVSFSLDPDGEASSSRGGGGLVSAMSTAASLPGALWLCAALSDADREIARAVPDGRVDLAGFDTGGAAVQMIDVAAEVLHGAYTSIANSTLWVLNHGLVDAPLTFDETWHHHWTSYVTYNSAFADAIASSANEGARVLVQDYHLNLLPAQLRRLRPDLRIAHFTHTPWATPREFSLLPYDAAIAVIEGLAAADSLGFHSARWAVEFAACAAGVGVNVTTPLRVHPLGVDAEPLLARAAEADVDERRTTLHDEVGDARIIGRVDRTEPAKNVYRGLLAFAELLRRHPKHIGRVVHVAVAYPSRQDVAEYRAYTELCVETAAEVNREFGTADWTPVRLDVLDDYPRSLATLASADVLLVNSLRDGMNLVAKEGILLSGNAALVLSRETGAADEMTDALLVDPLDVEGTADALHRALTMPEAERGTRHARLARVAAALPPQAWLQQQLDALV